MKVSMYCLLYDCSEDDNFWTCTLYYFFHGVRMQNWDCQQMTALHLPLNIELSPKLWYLRPVDRTLYPTTQKGSVHAKS